MEIREVAAGDLSRIAAIEKLAYPPALVFGEESLRRVWLEGGCQHLSFCVEVDGLVVGYLLPALINNAFGKSVHWMDIAVHPNHQRMGVGKMLVTASLQATRPSEMPISAHCRIGSYRLLTGHPELLAAVGYRVQGCWNSKTLFPGGEEGWRVFLEAI